MKNAFRSLGTGLTLLTLAAAADAQVVVYQNDGGRNQLTGGTTSVTRNYAANNGQGVGYFNPSSSDPFGPLLFDSETPQTAQSLFQPFTLGATGLGAGTVVNIALHGTSFNENTGGQTPVTVFASILTTTFAADGTPIPGVNVLNNVAVTLPARPQGFNQDQLGTSTVGVALTSALTPGGSYVLVIAPSAAPGATNQNVDLASTAILDAVNLMNGGAGNSTVYAVDNDSANTAKSGFIGLTTTGPLGFRIISAVPEPGQGVVFGLGALGLGLVALKRRRHA